MKSACHKIVTRSMTATASSCDKETKIIFKILLPSEEALCVVSKLFDRHGQELVNGDGAPLLSSSAQTIEARNENPTSQRNFAGVPQLHLRTFHVSISEQARKKMGRIGICIGAVATWPKELTLETVRKWQSLPDHLYTDLSAKTLAFATPGKTVQLQVISRCQANERLGALIERYVVLRKTDEVTSRTLEKIYFQIISGVKSPLLEPCISVSNPNEALDKYVYGSLKNMRREMHRERTTHFGFACGARCVAENGLDSAVADLAPYDDDESQEAFDRKMCIALGHLRDICPDPENAESVQSYLLKKESIGTLADKHGIKATSVRSRASRVRRNLGISKKQL